MKDDASGGFEKGRAVEICANIDDMTGEDLGAAMDFLLTSGALDVWFEQIQMKKNRPAVKLCALAKPEDTKRIAELMLRHTTSLGVRMREVERLMLAREIYTAKTRFGDVRFKRGRLGDEIVKTSPEYDDIRNLGACRPDAPGLRWRAGKQLQREV